MELRGNFFPVKSQRQNLRVVRLEGWPKPNLPPQPEAVHAQLGLESHEPDDACECKNISIHLKPAYFSWAGCSAS